MSKKTTASKPLPPNYIAVDDKDETVIAIGTKEQIIEIVQDYCNDSGWDGDDIEAYVSVYELGKQIDFNVATNVEIYF